jgi:hypothetical protein
MDIHAVEKRSAKVEQSAFVSLLNVAQLPKLMKVDKKVDEG